MKKTTVSLLFLLAATPNNNPMEIPIEIDLHEDQFHAWSHTATKTTTNILAYWIINEISKEPNKWANEKLVQLLTKDGYAATLFPDSCKVEIPLGIMVGKEIIVEYAKKILSTKIGQIYADRIFGQPPVQEITPTITHFANHVPTSNTIGYQQLQNRYEEQMNKYEEKIESSEWWTDIAAGAITGVAAIQFYAPVAHFIEHLDTKLTERFDVPQTCLCPVNYSIALASTSGLDKLITQPLRYLFRTLATNKYTDELLTEAAYKCECYKCLHEVLAELPKKHPWYKKLSAIASKLEANQKCCSQHS